MLVMIDHLGDSCLAKHGHAEHGRGDGEEHGDLLNRCVFDRVAKASYGTKVKNTKGRKTFDVVYLKTQFEVLYNSTGRKMTMPTTTTTAIKSDHWNRYCDLYRKT